MSVKDKLYPIILVIVLIFLAGRTVYAQDEVVVRPKSKSKTLPLPVPVPRDAEGRPLTPEEKYQLALARHMALQSEKVRLQILHDIKMTNDYYDRRKESKFVKWLKWQRFKLKRKGIL